VLVHRVTQHGGLTPPSPDARARCLERELPAVATAPAEARQVARQACQEWGVPDAADDVALVVSELVTNAVVHAKTPLILAIEHEGPTLAVAVGDGQPATPWMADQTPEQSGGRGLVIVSHLATTWGVVRTVLGKTVWVSLTVAPASSEEAATHRP
jgi:anti-sigma regulatory factor (Ser/Thr protein kinase)